MGIRAENVHLRGSVSAIRDSEPIKASVFATEMLRSDTHLYMSSGERRFLARFSGASRIKEGEELEFVFDLDKIHVFDNWTEGAII